MGMFDDISYTAPCPICGQLLTRWQSKSAGCSLDVLTPAELWQQRYDDETAANPNTVDFYDGCGNCGTWVEIRLAPALLDMTEHDYECLRQRIPLQRKRGPILPEVGRQRADDL